MPLLCRLEGMLSVDEAQLKINQLVVSVFPAQTSIQSNKMNLSTNREIKRPHLLLQLELVEGGLQHLLQPLGHRLHQHMSLFVLRNPNHTNKRNSNYSDTSTSKLVYLHLLLARTHPCKDQIRIGVVSDVRIELKSSVPKRKLYFSVDLY